MNNHFAFSGNKLISCNTSAIGRVKIPSYYNGIPVYEIGFKAFEGCNEITELIVPNGVTMIYDKAFSFCEKLESIYFADSVSTFQNAIFRGSVSLKNVRLPRAMTTITDTMFQYTALESLDIPNSVKKIDRLAFDGCTSLERITIPSSVEILGETAFNGCTNLKVIRFKGDAPEIELAGIAAESIMPEADKRLLNIGWSGTPQEGIYSHLFFSSDFRLEYFSDNQGFTNSWFDEVLRNPNKVLDLSL